MSNPANFHGYINIALYALGQTMHPKLSAESFLRSPDMLGFGILSAAKEPGYIAD